MAALHCNPHAQAGELYCRTERRRRSMSTFVSDVLTLIVRLAPDSAVAMEQWMASLSAADRYRVELGETLPGAQGFVQQQFAALSAPSGARTLATTSGSSAIEQTRRRWHSRRLHCSVLNPCPGTAESKAAAPATPAGLSVPASTSKIASTPRYGGLHAVLA
jgi:hypothetical protein